jgi:hypothetical protein
VHVCRFALITAASHLLAQTLYCRPVLGSVSLIVLRGFLELLDETCVLQVRMISKENVILDVFNQSAD